jgi:hypothetical protein
MHHAIILLLLSAGPPDPLQMDPIEAIQAEDAKQKQEELLAQRRAARRADVLRRRALASRRAAIRRRQSPPPRQYQNPTGAAYQLHQMAIRRYYGLPTQLCHPRRY